MRAFILPIAALLSCGSANAQVTDCDLMSMDYEEKLMTIDAAVNRVDSGVNWLNPSKEQSKKMCDISADALRILASIKAEINQNQACKGKIKELLKMLDLSTRNAQGSASLAGCR